MECALALQMAAMLPLGPMGAVAMPRRPWTSLHKKITFDIGLSVRVGQVQKTTEIAHTECIL